MLTNQIISDYDAVRSAVRKVSPELSFRLHDEPGSQTEHAVCRRCRPYDEDGADRCRATSRHLVLRFYDTLQKANPAIVQAAIGYAHAHGQLVGGNIFSGNTTYPPGSDFVAVDDMAVMSDGGVQFSLLADALAQHPPAEALARFAARDRAASTVDEGERSSLGYFYMAYAPALAVTVLRLNTELFPVSGNAFDSLGEAYVAAGDRERAIASYQRARARSQERQRRGDDRAPARAEMIRLRFQGNQSGSEQA